MDGPVLEHGRHAEPRGDQVVQDENAGQHDNRRGPEGSQFRTVAALLGGFPQDRLSLGCRFALGDAEFPCHSIPSKMMN
ncbi:hypothetical protein SDC9_50754 [bioreactor metagenome]|uniref:Uncharacterized protein n=1 Tax=bioreactor metagenome TaxID=1076179 RepID=A0A644WLM1_9ZZZZ